MLLLIGATFFIADGVQTTSAGALRGMHDTQVPLLFAVISYWLIASRRHPRSPSGPGSRPPASGSDCRSALPFMRPC